MIDWFEGAASRVATAAGRPKAFLLAVLVIIFWALAARYSIGRIPGSW